MHCGLHHLPIVQLLPPSTMINCNNLPEDENLYHINPTTTKHQQNTGRSMYSRHHPFVSSSSSSWPLSVGPTTPRRRRRRLNASSSTLTILLLPSYILAASNRALLTLLIWGCFCAVMATLPETAVATGKKKKRTLFFSGKINQILDFRSPNIF